MESKKYTFIYNNDFLSLLTLISYLIKNNIIPLNIKTEDYEPNLFDELINLELNADDSIAYYILKSFGSEVFNIIYKVYLSEEDNKELVIYYFLINALKYKNKVVFMHNKRCVTEALRIAKYVDHECHKFKGFTRFKELENNVLYAEIEPTNDILFMLSLHFKNRLKNEIWIIKDMKRKIFSVYDKKDFILLDENHFRLVDDKVSINEQLYKDMWCEFYKTIGIKSRKNDRCRRNFMPKKYWKYITEVSGEI